MKPPTLASRLGSCGATARQALWSRPKAPEHVIEELLVLTDAECERVREIVLQLRCQWTPRHPRLPFYSLGAANYFDIAGPAPRYDAMIRVLNPVLDEHFGWLYRKLEGALAAHLEAPVGMADGLARPGFHVFEFHEAFEHPRDVTQPQLFREGYEAESFSNPLHCDKAHLVVDWKGAEVDREHPISFTMTVSTPPSGAGLFVWDIHHDDLLELPGQYTMAELEPLLNTRRRHLHRYRLGTLALHSGLYLHQPEPGRELAPGCRERITLQGHGAKVRDEWRLFW